MKLKNTLHLGIFVTVSFICIQLRSDPQTDSTKTKDELKRIALEVPRGDLPMEVAAKILKGITEKAPEWTKTFLFNEALLACYYVDLTEDQRRCYKELSAEDLQEPLFCAIKDGFDAYNCTTNKDLKNFLLNDIRIPEQYDYLNDIFHADYEYWTYSMISWILKRRASNGDITAQVALDATITILGKALRCLDPIRIIDVLKKLLPLVDKDMPIVDTPLFQRSLMIAFPQCFPNAEQDVQASS